VIRALVISGLLAVTAQAFEESKPVEVTPASVDASIKRGIDFLVGFQNPNGSWGNPTLTKDLNIYAPIPGAHHAYKAGATGLAIAGMLDCNDPRPEVKASLAKASTWLASELPKLRRAEQTTTYNVWGHAYGLRAITRYWKLETDPAKKAEWVRLAQEQVELVNRYEDVNGGWGYLDLFDGLATRKPSGLPTSFTTATVLLALEEARRVMGVKLDDKLVELRRG
jgi:hypothetical protein